MNRDESSSDTDSSYNLNSWMADLHSSIKHLRMSELSLPGAHNAGMDNQLGHTNSYDIFQDYSIRSQLDHGIRVLDLRLRWYWGYESDFTRFRCFHTSLGGRTLGEVASAVDHFCSSNPGEIVILDIHKMESSSNSSVPYGDFHKVMSGHFASRLLPRTAVSLSLQEIKVLYPGRCVIVAAPSEVWGSGRDSTYFWDQIDHEWYGSGGVDQSRLHGHITTVMNNPPFSSYPWSMSATVYGAGGPGAIIPKLSEWYPTGGVWQRNSSIINFDFVTRNNQTIIHQCIESNKIKPPFPGWKILSPVQGEELWTSTPEVTGRGTPGATVSLAQAGVGGNFGEGTVNAEGIWKIIPSTGFHEGTFSLTAMQRRSGRASKWADPVTFTVGLTLPTPTISTPVNGSEVTTTRPLISGKDGAPGATVRFYEDGSGAILYGTATVDADRNWSALPTVELPTRRFPLTCDQVLNGLQSAYAEPSVFTVLSSTAKPEVPRSLSVQALQTSAKIIWLSPGIAAASYVYYLEGQPERTTVETEVQLNDLLSSTSYTIVVLAVSFAGVRSDAASVTFKTLGGFTQPTNFHVTANSARRISFAWGPPVDGAEEVIGYTFKVLVTGATTDVIQPSHTIYNLIPGIPLIVRVRCRFAGGGESPWNQITVTPQP